VNVAFFCTFARDKPIEKNGTLIQSVCTEASRKKQAALPDRVQAWRLFLFAAARAHEVEQRPVPTDPSIGRSTTMAEVLQL
jgi:hypothetical protein